MSNQDHITRALSGRHRPKERHGYAVKGSPRFPTYRIWQLMIQRCHNRKNTNYRAYGERGIFVCPEWRNSFSAFCSDMGERPSADHSIDRVDNDGPYCKENCRWTTRLIQARNTRRTIRIGDGECALDRSRKLGSRRGLVESRLRSGWPMGDAISRPMIPKFFGNDRVMDLLKFGVKQNQIAAWLGIAPSNITRIKKLNISLTTPLPSSGH